MTEAPARDIARAADAQQRVDAAVAGLDDDALRRPSLLPGWTVAHVLAHVARNADSHVRGAEAACRGETVDQYAGGVEGRRREIEATAARGAEEIVRDVRDSGARLHRAWESVPSSAWAVVSYDVSGRARVLRELPARRWQELEVHLVDLGIGVTYEDWSDEFVATYLPQLRQTVASRRPPGTPAPDLDGVTGREELAWLYGRLTRPSLPALAPWG